MRARGFWLLAGLLIVFSIVQAAALPKVRIAELKNLQQEARLVKRDRLPLLIMFSAQHCPYCVTVKEEFLKPMLRSGQYVDKVLIRRVELDGNQPIRDFNGESLSVRAFASRYKVFVTPTVVFIDGEGRVLTDSLIGIATVHYYGGYLDDAIDAALYALRKNQEGQAIRSQVSSQANSLSESVVLPLRDGG